jgi:hypothetical protein
MPGGEEPASVTIGTSARRERCCREGSQSLTVMVL